MNIEKKALAKWIVSTLSATIALVATIFGLQSCNVTRTITSSSKFCQRGDTSIIISTKTIETYDATKKKSF